MNVAAHSYREDQAFEFKNPSGKMLSRRRLLFLDHQVGRNSYLSDYGGLILSCINRRERSLLLEWIKKTNLLLNSGDISAERWVLRLLVHQASCEGVEPKVVYERILKNKTAFGTLMSERFFAS
jgi:hypothetical protein